MDIDSVRRYGGKDDISTPLPTDRVQRHPNFVSVLDDILKNQRRENIATTSAERNIRTFPGTPFSMASDLRYGANSEELSLPNRKFAIHRYFVGPTYSTYEKLCRLYVFFLVVPVVVALVCYLLPWFIPNEVSEIDPDTITLDPDVPLDIDVPPDSGTNWLVSLLAIANTISAIFFVDKWRNVLQETNIRLITKSIQEGAFNLSHFNMFHRECRDQDEPVLTWWELTGKKYVVALPLTVMLALVDVFCAYRIILLWSKSEMENYGSFGSSHLTYESWLPIVDKRILIGTVLLWTVTWMFVELARFLTTWENPQCHSSYISSLVGKIAFFTFVVNFSPICYIYYVMNNVEMTRCFTLTLQAVYTVLDVINDLLCCLKKRRRISATALTCTPLSPDDRDIYKDNVTMFLPLFVQIGLVFIFSTAVPTTLFLSLLSNLISLPLKAYRYQALKKEEIFRTSLEALQWQDILCMLLALALLVNCKSLNEAAAVSDLQHNLSSIFAWSILFLTQHIFMVIGVVVVIMPDNDLAKEAAIIRRTYRNIKAANQQAHVDKEVDSSPVIPANAAEECPTPSPPVPPDPPPPEGASPQPTESTTQETEPMPETAPMEQEKDDCLSTA